MVKGVKEIRAQHQAVTFKLHLKELRDAEVDCLLSVTEESVSTDHAAAKVCHSRCSEIGSWERQKRVGRMIYAATKKRGLNDDRASLSKTVQVQIAARTVYDAKGCAEGKPYYRSHLPTP